MIVKPFTPAKALLPYIHAYAYVEIDDIITSDNPVHIFPVEYTLICFTLDEKKVVKELHATDTTSYPFSYVGFLTRLRSFETFTKKVVQIYFKPFGAYKILGVPQHYFTNQSTDMESVLPGLSDMVNKMLDEVGSPEEIIKILESWLLRRLLNTEKNYVDRMAYACQLIQLSSGNLAIPELCNKIGMSQTTLRDHFKEKIGFSPKTFSRIIRFNQINKFICQHKDINWTELVYEFDFFDQNHFIKEFKQFFGCLPSQLHKKGHLMFTGQIDGQEADKKR